MRPLSYNGARRSSALAGIGAVIFVIGVILFVIWAVSVLARRRQTAPAA
jgi:uncharacterized membrane protein YtjA (UPF0391 family)